MRRQLFYHLAEKTGAFFQLEERCDKWQEGATAAEVETIPFLYFKMTLKTTPTFLVLSKN